MRATAAGFIFNAPRLISAIAPLIAGTLIVGLGGYGKAATIIGMFYILGLIAVPFLPETRGKPLPAGDTLAVGQGREAKARTAGARGPADLNGGLGACAELRLVPSPLSCS